MNKEYEKIFASLTPEKAEESLNSRVLLIDGLNTFLRAFTAIGWVNKDLIIRNLGKSPSLGQYFNYLYPYTFFLLLFYWLEAFAWGLHKGVTTNFLRETAIRIITTVLILLFGFDIKFA